MQKVQLFQFARAKVRGPMGVFDEERMSSCGADTLSHGGKEYNVGPDGWIEVPPDVFEAIRRMHHRHPVKGYTRWCTPAEVEEPLRLQLVDRAPAPSRRAAKASAQTA